jgi:hypothetical protein
MMNLFGTGVCALLAASVLLPACGSGNASNDDVEHEQRSALWVETEEGVGYNVLDAIPDNLEAGIFDRTGTTDLSGYIQTAINQVCAASVTTSSGTSEDAIVAFPAGTYIIEAPLVACDAVMLVGAKNRGRRGAVIKAGSGFESPLPGSCTSGQEYTYNCLRNPLVSISTAGVSHVVVADLVFDLNNLDVDGIRVTGNYSQRIQRCTFSNIKAGQAAVRGGATIDFRFSDNRTFGEGFSLDMRDLNVNSSAYYGINVGLLEGNYFQALGGVRYGGGSVDFRDNWLEGQLAATSNALVEACDNNAPGSNPVSEHSYRLVNNYFEVNMPDPLPDPLPAGNGIRTCGSATIEDNQLFGPGTSNNAYTALRAPLAASIIIGNLMKSWSSCANISNGSTSSEAAGVFLANVMDACPTFTVGTSDSLGLIQTPDGGYSLTGGSTSVGVVRLSLSGSTIDAAAGSLQELVTLVPREITQIDNKRVGQQLCLLSQNDLITLDANAFNRINDYQLVPGETACFIVDKDLELQSTNLPRETLAAPSDLPDLDWWLENDALQLQLSGTDVQRWFTRAGGSNRDVLQGTVALQPQWLSSGVDMQASRYLLGAGTVSDWSFLHQAGTLFVVFRPTDEVAGYLLGTGENEANSGLSLYYDAATGTPRIRVRVVNSSGTYAASFNTQTVFAEDNTYVFGLVLSENGTARAFRDYDEVGSDTLSTLSTAAPAVTVRVGNKGAGGIALPFPGLVYEVLHYSSELNNRTISAVVEMLRNKHGL